MCGAVSNVRGGTILANKKIARTSAKPKFTATDVLESQLGKKCPVWIYFASFFIPALIMLTCYAFFKIYPFGGRSVLALDLNGQYVFYFEAARKAFWGDASIFYSWGRNLSGGFMGIVGYYLASPFTLIVMLLPRTMLLESIMIMQLCKIGSAGLTFSIYLQKSKNVTPLHSLVFSTMYALMGYAVIQTIDPMWLDGVVFLPLIVLGIEYLIDDGRKLNYIIPLAVMFVANFYIGYMIAFFVAIYFFFYLFFGTQRKFKDSYEYVKVVGRMGLATVIALMCSAFMILPVYNALALGKFDFSKPDYSFQTQFSPIELVPTLLPNQYYSVNMQGFPEIYCGVLSVVLLPLFYLNKKIKKNSKIGYSLIILILLGSMYIKPVDMMWHGGQTPNWLPYRYSFLAAFVFVSMAAECFTKLDGYKLTVKAAGGTFAGITVVVMMFKALMKTFEYSEKKFKYVAVLPYTTKESKNGNKWTELWLGTILFGLILAAVYLILLYLYSRFKTKKSKTIVCAVMAAVVFFEAGYNAYDSLKKIDKEVYYSSRESYQNVIAEGMNVTRSINQWEADHDNSGIFRAEKTFFRNVNDNLAYGLRGVSHSSSVMNTRIINFLETMGYSMRSYVTRYDGNTSISDSLLGIKYVIHDPTISHADTRLNPNYEAIFTQDYKGEKDKQSTYHVYQNPDALSIGYMASDDILRLSHLGNDNPFNSQNMFLSTLTGNTAFYPNDDGTVTIGEHNEYFSPMDVTYELVDCTESPYGTDQTIFKATGEGDPTVRIHITPQSEQEVYMYLKTKYEKSVNTWISTEKDENGKFTNFKSMGAGSYFENHNYSIWRVGSYPAGTEIEVRLTLTKKADDPSGDKFAIIKNMFFYQFDYDLFRQDISYLAQNQWKLDPDKCTDRYLEGTITASEGQLMFTSIPSEPGWTVKVDGKKVETVDALKAFITIDLEPGEHTVTMKYTPPGFTVGVIALIFGLFALVLVYRYDKKNNKVILARIRAKKLEAEKRLAAAKDTPAESADEPAAEEKPEETAPKQEEPEKKQANVKKPNSGGNKKKKKKKR